MPTSAWKAKCWPRRSRCLDPPPFARQRLTEDMLTSRTPEAHRAVLERFREIRTNGQFEPPSLEGTIVFPGFDGGGEWGGAAFDPETGLLYVNANEMAWILRLVQAQPTGGAERTALYEANCAGCHREDLARHAPRNSPPRSASATNYTLDRVQAIVREGARPHAWLRPFGSDASHAIAALPA